jgi:hypothetical protein
MYLKITVCKVDSAPKCNGDDENIIPDEVQDIFNHFTSLFCKG